MVARVRELLLINGNINNVIVCVKQNIDDICFLFYLVYEMLYDIVISSIIIPISSSIVTPLGGTMAIA